MELSESEKLIENIKSLIWTSRFISYINYRKAGIKKKAQVELTLFLSDFSLQSHTERRKLINLIQKLVILTNDYSLYLPENLNKQCITPEIQLWMIEEPNNPTPHKWSSNLLDNIKGVELDPEDQDGLEKLAIQIINKVSMNQHELGFNNIYEGNPSDDISLLNFIANKIEKFQNLKCKKRMLKDLVDLKKNAMKHLN